MSSHASALKVFVVLVVSMMFGGMAVTASAQVNDPDLSKQSYLRVTRVLDAWKDAPFTSPSVTEDVPKTAIVGPGNVFPNHSDLDPTIPPGGNTTNLLFQPLVSTFVGGIMHATTNNGIGIAGINDVGRDNFLSYESGRLEGLNDIPQAIYVFDINLATTQTKRAIANDVDILLTPTATFQDVTPDVKVYASDFASPIVIPVLDQAIPSELVAILRILGGWFYEQSTWNGKLYTYALAHVQGAYSDVFSVAPSGDFDGAEEVYPASLTKHGIVFSVGGSDRDGFGRWRRSAYSTSNNPSFSTIDIVAPAEDVYSTLGFQYGEASTTAASAAQVAGVASLLKRLDPSLKADDLRQILRRTAVDLFPAGYDVATGYGLLDAKAAVDYVRNRDITHGVVKNGNVSVIGRKVDYRVVASPWSSLPSGPHFADEQYVAEWTIDLPRGSAHDVWIRKPGTIGISRGTSTTSTPVVTGTPHATVEVRSWESKAIIRTYGFQGENIDALGRRLSYGWPASGENAQVAYTIATTPGPPPPAPLSISLQGPDKVYSGYSNTWSVSYSGAAAGPVSFEWSQQLPGTNTWTSAPCSSTSCTLTFYGSTSDDMKASVRVRVSKGGYVETRARRITVSPPSSLIPGPSPIPIDGGEFAYSRIAKETVQGLKGTAGSRQEVQLHWTSPANPSVSKFFVEHRSDSLALWSVIGEVEIEARKASGEEKHSVYQFETSRLGFGDHEFRIRFHVPYDGREEAVVTKAVSIPIASDETHDVLVYPTPMHSQATVDLAVTSPQDVSVEVFDLLGRRVGVLYRGHVQPGRSYAWTVDVNRLGLSSGNYFVRLTGENFAATERLTVVR